MPHADHEDLVSIMRGGDVDRVASSLADIDDLPTLNMAGFSSIREGAGPQAVTLLFQRYLCLLARDGRDDAGFLKLMAKARNEGLAAARVLHLKGDKRPIITRLALEEAVVSQRTTETSSISELLLNDLPITAHHIVGARQLLHLGQRQIVVDWIEAVERSKSILQSPKKIRASFADLANHTPREDGEGSAVTVYERAGSKKIVFAFTGFKNRFGVELSTLVSWMADIDAHLVVLRDPFLLLYLKGIPELGDDMASSAQALVRLAHRLGATEIYCMGSSAGGYAAIRYGLLLGATRVLAFAAPIGLTAEAIRADGRAVGVANRLLADDVLPFLGDLKELLKREASPPRIELFYGDGMIADRLQSEWLEGIPGVSLWPVKDYDGHAVVKELQSLGEIQSVLKTMLES